MNIWDILSRITGILSLIVGVLQLRLQLLNQRKKTADNEPQLKRIKFKRYWFIPIGGLILAVIFYFIGYYQSSKITPPIIPRFKDVPAVCIWDSATIHKKNSTKALVSGNLDLGEKVTWLEKLEKKDPNDSNYVFKKICHSDGKTEGWVRDYEIEPKARRAAVTKESNIYEQPDLAKNSVKKFDPLDFVAIKDSKKDWFEVIGINRIKKGWIKKDGISFDQSDIIITLKVFSALNKKNKDVKLAKLNNILNNSDLSNSIFIPRIKELISEIKSSNSDTSLIVDRTSADTINASDSNASITSNINPQNELPEGRITVFNASNRNGVAANIGYYLSIEFGVRYNDPQTSMKKRYSTIIYYGSSEWRTMALQIERKMPGKQDVKGLPPSFEMEDFRDIVIYVGNDCANYERWITR